MALVFADLVQETTSTAGTGTLTLTGAVAGFQTFAAIGSANTTYYRIKSGNDSEVGLGTYTSAGTTLSRDTVLYSTAGGTTKITVAAGATVICTYPAGKAVLLNAAGTLVTTLDATINGITVGKGAGAIGTNTAVGASALVSNTSGQYCTAVGLGALSSNSSQWYSTAVGYLALQTANASGNTAVGFQAAKATTSGGNNSAFGLSTMEKNTTGVANSAFGQGASYTCISGSNNSAFGVAALFSNTAGNNSAFGYNAGSAITTGANNVVIGSYTGAAAPISLTGSNYIVLSDGAANVRQTYNASGALAFGTAGTEFGTSGQVLQSNGSAAVPTWGTAITSGTSVTASTTAVLFTGIPSWAKRITVMFNGLATNGTSLVQIQLGATTLTTTGYIAYSAQMGSSVSSSSSITGLISSFGGANLVRQGTFTLTNLSGNIWVATHCQGTISGPAYTGVGAGAVTLSGVLDRLNITTVNGTDTFTAGLINIFWD